MKYSEKELREIGKSNRQCYLPKYIMQEIICTLYECINEMNKAGVKNEEVMIRTRYMHKMLIERLVKRNN